MTLKVIGAGLGRTGTLTLKTALEQLGFGRCYHMLEVFANPQHRAFWLRAAQGEAVDWAEVLGPYGAAVDWPSCHFYAQLAERYPDAKIVLTVRDPEEWYESMQATILKSLSAHLAESDAAMREEFQFVRLIIAEQTFHDDFSEASVIAAYEWHVAAVQRTIPADRLLVYEITQGWDPLCSFLGVDVPSEAYPRTNSREEFWAHAEAAAEAP